MTRITWLLLFLIVALAAVLRFYKIQEIPAGFFFDEATVGVNSYFLAKSGHDELGNFLPDFIKIGDDFRHVAIFYATVPFIKLFALNEFAVRSATAFFSVLIVAVTYFLTRTLLGQAKIALLSSALIAISPWLINLSRSSNEIILSLLFLMIADIFLLLGLKNCQKNYFALSYVFMVLTWFSYSGAILISLLHYVFLVTVSLITERPKKIKIMAATALVCLVLFPNMFYWLTQPSKITGRFNQVSIFSEKGTQLILEEQIREDGAQGPTSITTTRLFHNKLTNFSNVAVNNYLRYFSGPFLQGTEGLPLRYKIPGFGQVFLIDLPFFLAGLYFLARRLTWQKIFIIFWLLAGPIPASLTLEDSPNVQRAIFMLPAWQIITAFGIYTVFGLQSRIIKYLDKVKYYLAAAILVVYLYLLALFMHQLFIHQPRHQNWYRNSEWSQAASLIDKLGKNYSQIIMTKGGTEPHYYLMFYSNNYREQFQNDSEYLKNRNLKNTWSLDKFTFSQNQCVFPGLKEIKLNTLYINGQICSKPPGWARIVGEAKTSDGVVMLTFADVPLSESKLQELIRQQE